MGCFQLPGARSGPITSALHWLQRSEGPAESGAPPLTQGTPCFPPAFAGAALVGVDVAPRGASAEDVGPGAAAHEKLPYTLAPPCRGHAGGEFTQLLTSTLAHHEGPNQK